MSAKYEISISVLLTIISPVIIIAKGFCWLLEREEPKLEVILFSIILAQSMEVEEITKECV